MWTACAGGSGLTLAFEGTYPGVVAREDLALDWYNVAPDHLEPLWLKTNLGEERGGGGKEEAEDRQRE